jgi:hypothetical protein
VNKLSLQDCRLVEESISRIKSEARTLLTLLHGKVDERIVDMLLSTFNSERRGFERFKIAIEEKISRVQMDSEFLKKEGETWGERSRSLCDE